LNITRILSCTPTRPVTLIWHPGSMPAMRRRPSQTSVISAEPS
jgi:hypothetical protein